MVHLCIYIFQAGLSQGAFPLFHVMYNGTVMAELETANTTEDEIMYYSVGGKDNKNGK